MDTPEKTGHFSTDTCTAHDIDTNLDGKQVQYSVCSDKKFKEGTFSSHFDCFS